MEPWAQLSAYLVCAEALGDSLRAGVLEAVVQRRVKPIAMWSDAGLQQLAGTQAYDVGMQYRRARARARRAGAAAPLAQAAGQQPLLVDPGVLRVLS